MYNYSFSILLFCVGLYVVLASKNQMRKLFGLSFLQTAVLWFYISLGKVYGGKPPILQDDGGGVFSNPLPQVLMLTAIVVGLATLSLGLVLVIKMKSLEE
jgi:multicomponent Na+:H+ antiporter subunit C